MNKIIRKTGKIIFNICSACVPKYIKFLLMEKLPIVEKGSFPDADIKYCCRSRIEFYSRRNEWKSEPETVGWIKKYFDGGVFYDIGANIGTFSLITATLGKAKKIFSFEPSYATFLPLCENVRVNKLEDIIVPVHMAIGDNNGIIKFYYQSVAPGDSCHNLGENINWSGKRFNEAFAIPMISCSVDRFVEEFNAPFPDYIKIDVDGIELKILKGMKKILSNLQLKTVLVESNKNEEEEFMKIMGIFGFMLDKDLMNRHYVKHHKITGSINLIFIR